MPVGSFNGVLVGVDDMVTAVPENRVGEEVGKLVGAVVGASEGKRDGVSDGNRVGLFDGKDEGRRLGSMEGLADGNDVGCCLCSLVGEEDGSSQKTSRETVSPVLLEVAFETTTNRISTFSLLTTETLPPASTESQVTKILASSHEYPPVVLIEACELRV